MSRWTSWLAAALLALTVGLAPAHGQTTATNAPVTGTEKPSALPYAVAAGMAIVLLLIVCMPSRKAQ
jgi:hypothetical protein